MTMRRTCRALLVALLAALVPSVALARGYGRSGGYVNTPFGPIPMSTMNMAGGNPLVASDMQQQMMMYQQQQQMMKQYQQYTKQMEQMKKAGLLNPDGTPKGSTPPAGTGKASHAFTTTKKKKKHTTTTKSATTAPAKGDKGKETTKTAASGDAGSQ
jgi:hypothetical protein